jgi:MerR family transcriptional regulator, light-induced transcriptional regulator
VLSYDPDTGYEAETSQLSQTVELTLDMRTGLDCLRGAGALTDNSKPRVDAKDMRSRNDQVAERQSDDWSHSKKSNIRYASEQPVSSADRERADRHRNAQSLEEDRLVREGIKADELARAIEAEIIPRLLLSHIATRTIKTVIQAPKPLGEGAFSDDDVAAFATLVMQKPLSEAISYIDGLLDKGMTTETMILDVLSPSARHLGIEWENDKITFVDVTLGLSRLQQLLRVYGPAFEVDFAPDHKGHRILLAAMPGEQHTFGMSVVEEFFRRDGWDVNTEANISRGLLLGRVRDEWFDVVGLSASGDASVALLAPLIAAIRDAALNRHIRVIVGGCQFLAEPANALALGADMVACNGREAVLNVDRLMSPGGLQ